MRLLSQFVLSLILTFPLAGLTNAAEPTEQQAAKEAPKAKPARPLVVMQTNLGDMVIELFPDKAPKSVENFLAYVDDGFYNGVIFHRVIAGFMVQGGGFDTQYQRKATRAPIVNESDNRLPNKRGTLSMARTNAPNSATTQFFINLNDNPSLDWKPNRPGYAVYGRVIKGIEVIDKMAALPQGNHSGVFVNAPNDQVVITKAFRQKSGAIKTK